MTSPSIADLACAIQENDEAKLQDLCGNANVPTFSDDSRHDHWISDAIDMRASTSILQILMDAGVDPHAMPEVGYRSPLQAAVFRRRPDCLRFLLEFGVDPNCEMEDRRITLSAVSSSVPTEMQLEMLQLLVEHDVDINFQFTLFGDKDKLFTVLDKAANDEVIAYLRSVGAKTSAELSGKEHSGLRVSLGEHLDEVRAFFEKEFGPAEDRSFQRIVTGSPGIAVHVIKSRTPQGPITLFTTGLSSEPMNVPPELAEHAYAELFMLLPGDWDFQSSDPRFAWPMELMLNLAALPRENDAFYAVPLTTIANGEPAEPLGPNVRYDATALLTSKSFERSDGRTVHLFCVLPIYEEEAAMARNHVPDFLNALDAADVSRVLTLDRPSVAK